MTCLFCDDVDATDRKGIDKKFFQIENKNYTNTPVEDELLELFLFGSRGHACDYH